MTRIEQRILTRTGTVALGLLVAALTGGAAAAPGTESGQWRYLGGDSHHTRYTPLE